MGPAEIPITPGKSTRLFRSRAPDAYRVSIRKRWLDQEDARLSASRAETDFGCSLGLLPLIATHQVTMQIRDGVRTRWSGTRPSGTIRNSTSPTRRDIRRKTLPRHRVLVFSGS